MKKLFLFTLALCSISLHATPLFTDESGVPAESEIVMLQGFHWDSYQNNSIGRTKWIDLLTDTVAIRDQFDAIWLPPSGSGGGVGYYPKRWSLQDSDWGTKAKLQQLIQALHRGNTLVLADVVVNHHQSSTGWANFSEENFGTYGSFQLTQSHICAGDEAFTQSGSDVKGSANHGAADTGDNDPGCRDLDHTNTYVQDCVKAYVQWLCAEMGYDGFRYDMTKGYHGRYVAMYNRAASPALSVAETYDGSVSVLKNYISASEGTTLVFDFATKYNIFNGAIAQSNYGALKEGKTNKLHREPGYGRYSVTFIDNHDTFNRGEGNEYKDNTSRGASITNSANHAKVLEANAYLLAMPGIPCVFYPHWKTFPTEIGAMIRARKLAGIHSESVILSEETGGPYRYQAIVQGHHGKLILRIGSSRDKDCPDGYTLIAHGKNFDIYVETFLTALPQSTIAPTTHAHKIFREGKLLILSGDHTYNIQGQEIH